MTSVEQEPGKSLTGLKKVRRLPPEVSILLVLFGIILVFEVLGWFIIGQASLRTSNAFRSSFFKWPSLASSLSG